MYERDLAHVHDAGFGFFARGAAPGIVRRLRRAHIDRGVVVDLGCGSGILARKLTDAGYDVLGVDASGPMLDIARERAPDARFVQASLHEAELPPCAAITAVGEIFCYAGIRARLFERLHAALAPGGVLLFDVATPGREGTEPRRAWHEGDGWLVCMEARANPEGTELTRRIATFLRAGDAGWRRSDETHTLSLYDPAILARGLRAAGFADVQVLAGGYGPELSLPHGLAVIEARR
jgi:SAM-dependent methyltransferase